MPITARNTTTPDSTRVAITVTGAADEQAAKVAAYEELARSPFTRGSVISEVTRTGHGDYVFTADYS